MRVSDSERDLAICELYASRRFTTKHIAAKHGLTARQVQRIVKRYGLARTQAEGNRVAAPLKPRHRIRRS